MKQASALVKNHNERTIVVMGGGPSLPGDMELVFHHRAPYTVSVKQHGLLLQPRLGFMADYVAFLEDPSAPDQAELRTALLLCPEVEKVSPFPGWTDVELDVPWWQGGFSSTLAVWFACWLAGPAGEVLLAGMDCYQGPKKYWYSRPGYAHPCFDAPLEHNLDAWRKAFDHVPHPERIRAVSGPLVELFGRWI